MSKSQSHSYEYSYSYSKTTHLSGFEIMSMITSKILTVSILAPFNFVENRFQVMAEMKRNGNIPDLYKSYTDCIQTAIKQENGIKALWKGNFAKILLSFSGLAFSLTAGSFGKKQITKIYKSTTPQAIRYLKYFGNFAGMISSLGSIILTYPLEYAYVRLLSDKQSAINKPKQFKGIGNVILKTLGEDGLKGVYRGVFTSFGAIALYRVSYFGLYDLWKELQNSSTTLFDMFLASYCITLTSSIIAYPANTIRKRMMMRSLEAEKYKWSGECLRYIIKNQGYLALYRGFPMALITAISNSLLLIVYDKMISPYTKHQSSVQKV